MIVGLASQQAGVENEESSGLEEIFVEREDTSMWHAMVLQCVDILLGYVVF